MSTNGGKTTKKGGGKGLDSLLQKKGKSLQTGQRIRFTLVKGPSINRDAVPDPVNPSAPKEYFPLVAKFPESVVRPNFTAAPFSTARLYQQDVPKAQGDSDEEAEEAAALAQRKRRWRKRNEPPKRQWVLQEQVEFLETMMAKRQKKADIYPPGQLSSRYEGIPEHNPSHYVLMECRTTTTTNGDNNNNSTDDNPKNNAPTITVTLLPQPPNTTVAFAQPASRKTLSMSEAEQAIQDQRTNTSRYMMHDKGPSNFMNAAAAKPINQSKARLMGKLQQKLSSVAAAEAGGEEGDDIMADVAFRDRKGNTRARKELLTTLGDESIKVDDDGILGGTNDEEFGGKRHFGAFRAAQDEKKKAAGGDDNTATAEKGNAGMAMEDGFYQRDVKAEYDELDYDIDEQFDDDDVDVGETEVMADGGGFAQDEDEEDEAADEDAGGGEAVSGAEGLASVAGFKAMLAKARGEVTNDTNQANEAASAAANGTEAADAANSEEAKRAAYLKAKTNATIDPSQRHLEEMFAAAESARIKSESKESPGEQTKKAAETSEVQTDANGLRIVSLQAIRKEIWLNHGSIAMKRLLKLFEITKKTSPDRQNKFREVIKELCTMKTDPVGGRMLVLKQHYSNLAD